MSLTFALLVDFYFIGIGIVTLWHLMAHSVISKNGEGVSWDEFIRHSKTLAGTDIFVNW